MIMLINQLYFHKGKIESYNIGSNNEINNNKIVNTICSVGHS